MSKDHSLKISQEIKIKLIRERNRTRDFSLNTIFKKKIIILNQKKKKKKRRRPLNKKIKKRLWY